MHTFSNHLLVASNDLNGSFYERKVVYILDHGDTGSLGVVINKPLDTDKADNFIKKLDLTKFVKKTSDHNVRFYEGGPLYSNKSYVLHNYVGEWETTTSVASGLSLTVSEDILKHYFEGTLLNENLLIVGYSGWGKQQLEDEIKEGLWHLTPLDKKIVFNVPYDKCWQTAINKLDINSESLILGKGYC